MVDAYLTGGLPGIDFPACRPDLEVLYRGVSVCQVLGEFKDREDA